MIDEDQGKIIGKIDEAELRQYAENHLGYPPPRDRVETARARLDQLTEEYARLHGVGLNMALAAVTRSEEGKSLWEELRREELAEGQRRR